MSKSWDEMSDAERQSECEVSTAPKSCTWEAEAEDCYRTACRKHFEFSDGGVADNGFEFCPFCGRTLTIKDEGDS